MKAGIETERFWSLNVPEVAREIQAVNQRRRFFVAQACNVANYAFAEEVATMDRFMGRSREPDDSNWGAKAHAYFSALAEAGDG